MGRLKRTSNKRKTSRKRSPSAYGYKNEENIQERLISSKYNFKTFASRKIARPVVKSLYNSEYDNNFNIEGDPVMSYKYSA
jgi:hypothetical protein